MLHKIFIPNSLKVFPTLCRHSSSTAQSCKVLIVGGGCGGCATAAKFARKFNDPKQLIVLEPSDTHYYQPMFTMIGGGVKDLEQAQKKMSDVLPSKSTWIQDEVSQFFPNDNKVTTKKGETIKYEFMLVAVGLQTHYEKIPGLLEALNLQGGGVGSNYDKKYVMKTLYEMQNFKGGNAIFTYPDTPVKCPGAPQKICYLAEHYWRNQGVRSKANIMYNTSLPVLFGVKKYADSLWKVCKKRNINVNLRTNLVSINPSKKEATFVNLDKGEELVLEYSFMHVTPPMSSPDVVKNCEELVNDAGFVDVNKQTLQHVRYPNVFAIGDCSSTPNSKTAAAAAAQLPVVFNNMLAVMDGQKPILSYDGYASCPLVTGYGTCILAEFDYNLTPLETFPIEQGEERQSMYTLKKDVMPQLYWHLMLNGFWNGPEKFRNLLHLNFS